MTQELSVTCQRPHTYHVISQPQKSRVQTNTRAIDRGGLQVEALTWTFDSECGLVISATWLITSP